MPKQNTPTRHGLNRRSSALIAVLAVVLVTLLYVQFGGSDAPPKATSREGKSAETIEQSQITAEEEAPQRTPWEPLPVDDVAAFDPFALPPPMLAIFGPPPQAADDVELQADAASERERRVQESLANLRSQGVSMIVRDETGLVAAIGDRLVKQDDMLGEFRVAEVNHDGIVLELAEPSEQQETAAEQSEQ